MRQRHRVPLPRVFLVLAVIGFLASAPAYPSGFQVMTQGARATGMGLAFAGVADDPTAIFYNPAGLGWQEHFSGLGGFAVLGRSPSDFTGANPYPGVGQNGSIDDTQQFLVPHLFVVMPLTAELNFGLAIDAPYGLGLRWNNPNTAWSGRYISQNAVIKTTDLNPVFSYRLFPELSIAAGASYRFSGVQLERNVAAVDPFTGAVVDVAHTKLKSDLMDNGGWGWNVAIMWKPVEAVSVGASYRSKIKVNYDGTATLSAPASSGWSPTFQGMVAASGLYGEYPVETSIEFPASLNTGLGIHLGGGWLVSLEADWTEWSSFGALDINFPNGDLPNISRATAWTDTWAYRGGIEKKLGDTWAVRVGYYYDNSPQPTADVGPLLADSDRNVYTAGIGYNTPQFGLDLGGGYIAFKKRSVLNESTDNFFGTYSETGWVVVGDLRISF